MRPKAPKARQAHPARTYIPFVWNRLSFLHKVSIRNIVRYKKRLFMMLLGVGGCTALIVAGSRPARFHLRLSWTISSGGVTHYQIAVDVRLRPWTRRSRQAFRESYADEHDAVHLCARRGLL